MKLSSITIFVVVANSTAFIVAPTKSYRTKPIGAKKLTKFDRIKAKWKGPTTARNDDSAGFSYEDFEAAVAETDYAFNRNDVVKGHCVEYENGGCIVEIGAKAPAYMPGTEAGLFQPENARIEDIVKLNEEMDFEIISDEDYNGQLRVSIRRIQYREAWQKVVVMQELEKIFEAEVVAVNRGGAICLVEGLRAFLPGSHVSGKVPDEEMIGQTIPLKFLEVNQENNKLVVSNRKAVVEQQMSNLSLYQVVEGSVSIVKPYGVFVNFGGMSGLLHISQISHHRVDDLQQTLQPGTKVKCMIIHHDIANGRVSLSTKTLEPQPGDLLIKPDMVFEKAEETARAYVEKLEAESKAREEATREIVLGLGDTLDDLAKGKNKDSGEKVLDPLAEVSESIGSLLS